MAQTGALSNKNQTAGARTGKQHDGGIVNRNGRQHKERDCFDEWRAAKRYLVDQVLAHSHGELNRAHPEIETDDLP